jgi:DNA-binding response OmpR family regulator
MEKPLMEQKKPAPKASVLLVDDDKFLLDMYAMKFTQQGYAVHAALSVGDALEALRAGFAADAVVFYLMMPERDGFSFLEAIRDEKLAPNAVRIALTNQSQDADKVRARDLGAESFIIKATMIPSEVVNMVASEILKHRKA